MKKILVIAPHPDDEILGCGATMAKEVVLGNVVYVLICTNGYSVAPELFPVEEVVQTQREALQAHKVLEVKDTIFLDFPAPKLDQCYQYKISKEMNDVIQKLEIDTVYIPHRGDRHMDHTIIHDCAMVACRPLAKCPVKHVYAYETLSETEWGEPIVTNAFVPTKFNTFSKDEFAKKLEAIKCYTTQLRVFPSSRSLETIEALAIFRGTTVSAHRAEAFEVLRDID